MNDPGYQETEEENCVDSYVGKTSELYTPNPNTSLDIRPKGGLEHKAYEL
jgi:hypothetical protein